MNATNFVPYSLDVEHIASDEHETIDDLMASMTRLADRNGENGVAIRVSHGKSYGVAVGALTVYGHLEAPFAQGLFSQAREYDVIARLANVPGEITSDEINTQRGLSFKVLGVAGDFIPEHGDGATQDFVLDTGDRFIVRNVKEFLSQHLLIEHAPQLPDGLKATVSNASRIAADALHAVGADSVKLGFFGGSKMNPFGESYYSQAPIRYGDYIAKIALFPASESQADAASEIVDSSHDDDALRTATVGYLRENDAVFDVRVQLCTNLQTMPVEDAHVAWSQEESPYVTVARLTLPKQDAYSEARAKYVDSLSFSPAHSLVAHRRIGSIMRARLIAYPLQSKIRRERNGSPHVEPRSVDEVPA